MLPAVFISRGYYLFQVQYTNMPTYSAWQYTTQGRLSGTVTRVTRSRKDEVEDDEVLIQVKAAAVNPVDEQL